MCRSLEADLTRWARAPAESAALPEVETVKGAPVHEVPKRWLVQSLFYTPMAVLLAGVCLTYLYFLSKAIVRRHTGERFPLRKLFALTVAATGMLNLSLGFILFGRTRRVGDATGSDPGVWGIVFLP